MKYEEMLKEIEDWKSGARTFNQEYISKLNEYVNCTEKIKHISELLQDADKIRRKYNNDETKEKVEVMDADGRKKTILKENESEYIKLVEQKKEYAKTQQRLYSEIIKLQSRKNEVDLEEKIVAQPLETEVSPTKSTDSNIQVTEENMKEKFLKAVEAFESDPLLNIPIGEQNIHKNVKRSFEDPKVTMLVDLNDYLNKNNIKLNHLGKLKFKNIPKANLEKAFTSIKKKLSLNKFKKLMPTLFNVDKYVELGAAKLHGKLLDSGIFIKDKGVKFKNGVKQTYNSAKSFITNIPKRTKDYIKDKYNDVKKYLSEKKEIIGQKKEGKTTKEAMEHVYGENKDKHLDYRIVNRVTNFKENTCQRISSVAGKIGSVSKNVCDAIAKPFRYLRDNVRDNVKREALQNQINRIREENLAKKRVLTNPELAKSRGGYVGSIALISVSIIILSVIIFLGIGSLLGR